MADIETINDKVLAQLQNRPRTAEEIYHAIPSINNLSTIKRALDRLRLSGQIDFSKDGNKTYWIAATKNKATMKTPKQSPVVQPELPTKTYPLSAIMGPDMNDLENDIDAALANWNTMPKRQAIDDIILITPLTIKVLERCYQFALDTNAPEPIPTVLKRHIENIKELSA